MKIFQPLEANAAKSSKPWNLRFAICDLRFAFACAVAGFVAAASAAELPKLSAPLKRLGSVELDPVSKVIVTTGFLEQASGVLDYLVCGLEGRRYEGLVTLELSATDLQAAFLLTGAKAGRLMTGRDAEPPQGSAVNIWIEWETNGVKKIYPGEDLIWNRKDDKPVVTEWKFTGSRVSEGRFAASEDQNYIAVRWDPNSIVNIGHELGRSYGDIFVNSKLVPATNTPVKVYFQAK